MRPRQRARAASAEGCCPSSRCRSSVLAAPAVREYRASYSPSYSSCYRCAPPHRRTSLPPHLRTCAPANRRTCAPAHLRTSTAAHLRTSTLAPLQAFVAERSVDVVLVAKSRHMLSAAQSIRIRLEPPASVQAPLPPALTSTPTLTLTLTLTHQRAGKGKCSNPHLRLQALLEPRLRIKARQLARLSASGQLVIFMGSGMSKTAGLPSWSELLAEIATSVS